MLRPTLRFLARVDDLLELVVRSLFRFAVTRRGALLAGLGLIGAASVMWVVHHRPGQGPRPGALVPALAGPDLDLELQELRLDESLFQAKPAAIDVDVIAGRHGNHCGLVTYQGRCYRVRPGTLLPQDGPPSLVITQVSCDSVQAYDWVARQTIHASRPAPVRTGISEELE